MEESEDRKIMDEGGFPWRMEGYEDPKRMERYEDPKRMEESPPKRSEYRELNLKNRRGLSITVRILWCIFTIISAFLVQKNNWTNLIISLTTGELIGYITMKTLTSTKIMISPKTLWIHIVDGINTGVPLASTITLYYLEDVDDWATILRGTLGVVYIFLCTTDIIHIFMKIVYIFLIVGCLYRFFGYTSFPAILISIVFGGGCLLLLQINHLGEKVRGMEHEGENNMDINIDIDKDKDIPKIWSLKEERTHKRNHSFYISDSRNFGEILV